VTETLEFHVFSCLWKSVYYFYGNLKEEPERSWEKGGWKVPGRKRKRRRDAESGRNRGRGKNLDDLRERM